jgi:RNA polymerase sigma-70 factor (ECF subfamily)
MSEPLSEKVKQKAFMDLYEPVHERFSWYCHARLGNTADAKDLISETVLVAYDQLMSLRKSEAFLFFLFGIATRLIQKKSRRRKFWGLFKEKECARIKDPGLSAEAEMDVNILYQALHQLPESHREAIILFEISGFSLKEIQEIQQVSLSAVKARLVRGRKKLGQLLKDPETDFNFGQSIRPQNDLRLNKKATIETGFYQAV